MTAPTYSTLDRICDLTFTFDAPACLGVVDVDGRLELCDGPFICHVDDLIGFTAPVWWAGIAFVGDGRGVRIDSGDEHRLRVTVAIGRDGQHASSITSELGADRLGGPGLPEDRPAGHIPDLCHRALGLAAAPEATTPDVIDHVRWLDEVWWAANALGPALDPDDVGALLALHPRLGAPTPRTWEQVHRGLVELGCGWGRFSADDLAWMDAPTWARYVLDESPDLDTMLADIGQVLSTSAMAVVHAMVGRGADSVRAGQPGGGG